MHEIQSELEEKLSGKLTREFQTFLVKYALQTDGLLHILATVQVAIIITVLFLNYTTKEVLTILPLQRSTRKLDIYQVFESFVTTTDTSLIEGVLHYC